MCFSILHLVFAFNYNKLSWVKITVLKDQVLEKHEPLILTSAGDPRFFPRILNDLDVTAEILKDKRNPSSAHI